MIADITALLELEKAKMPKERFYSRRPPYPVRLLSKPYSDRYEPPTMQYDGRKESTIENVSKFVDTMGQFAGDKDLCVHEFSKSLCDHAYI